MVEHHARSPDYVVRRHLIRGDLVAEKPVGRQRHKLVERIGSHGRVPVGREVDVHARRILDRSRQIGDSAHDPEDHVGSVRADPVDRPHRFARQVSDTVPPQERQLHPIVLSDDPLRERNRVCLDRPQRAGLPQQRRGHRHAVARRVARSHAQRRRLARLRDRYVDAVPRDRIRGDRTLLLAEGVIAPLVATGQKRNDGD